MFWFLVAAIVFLFGILPMEHAASPNEQRGLLITGGVMLAPLFLWRRYLSSEHAFVGVAAGAAFVFRETYILDKPIQDIDDIFGAAASAVLLGIIGGFLGPPADRARRWIRVRLFSRGRPSTPQTPVPSSWPAWSWSAILARSDPPSSSWRGRSCEGL